MRTALIVLTAALCAPGAVHADGSEVGYDKGFFIKSADGDYKLKLNSRFQARFAYLQEDIGPGDLNYAAFSIPAARLQASGHAHSKDVRYGLQLDFSKGGAGLKDAFVDVAVLGEKLNLRVGQFKRPFSRQDQGATGKHELVDQAITAKAFGTGRDIGLMIANDRNAIPTVEWALGLFNGTGDKPWFEGAVWVYPADGKGVVGSRAHFTNVPERFHPQAVARVAYNLGKIKGYSEADLEGGPLRASFGLAGSLDFDADDDNVNRTRGTVDYIVKAHGFSSTGAFFVLAEGPEIGDQSRGLTGFFLQAGHVFDGRYQPVARYAIVSPKSGDAQHERVLGVSVYLHGHNLKLQTEGAQLATGDLTDYRVQSQLQFAF